MSKVKKLTLYISIFILGLTMLILQAFFFEAPDGFFGFLLCLASVYLMLGSIIKICKTSENFKNTILCI